MSTNNVMAVFGCHTCCDRVWVWCVGAITQTQRVLYQALNATRGDRTLHREYTSWSALLIGGLLHMHTCLYVSNTDIITIISYHLPPPYVLTKGKDKAARMGTLLLCSPSAFPRLHQPETIVMWGNFEQVLLHHEGQVLVQHIFNHFVWHSSQQTRDNTHTLCSQKEIQSRDQVPVAICVILPHFVPNTVKHVPFIAKI